MSLESPAAMAAGTVTVNQAGTTVEPGWGSISSAIPDALSPPSPQPGSES